MSQPKIRQLRVMSYNINGLPWPLQKKKGELFSEIAHLLLERRKLETDPDILFLQEGFSNATKDLIRLAGYPHVYQGSKAWDKNRLDKGANGFPKAIVGCGLWILSKYPFVEKDKMAFGSKNCTGSDCLANKGLMFARIEIPDIGKVDLFNTHMNCFGASGSPRENVTEIQQKQLAVTEKFILEKNQGQYPIIFAGDFNISTADVNSADLINFMEFYNAGIFCENNPDICEIGEQTLPRHLHVSHDQHLFKRSASVSVLPVYAAKCMRENVNGRPLSDHLAYEVIYQLESGS